MKKINWGILATGKITRAFAEAVNVVDDACLYAVASRNIDKANAFAKEFGAKKAYGSYEEIASDPNVDIIYVATPMSLHYENVKMCFEHGKNVLCEKTITLNSKQLRELIAIAKDRNLFFMEAMWMKCLPFFRKAHEWYKDGKIGEIKAIKADFSNACNYNSNDRLFRNDLGGGALLDLCVYPLSFVTSFLGFDYKNIMSSVHIGGENVDMNEAIIMQYENAFASIFTGFCVENENRAVIVGEKGRISTNPWFFCGDNVRLYDNNGKMLEESVTPHIKNGYEYEIIEANACLNADKKESALVPLCDTLSIMEIMDKIRSDWNFTYVNE